MDPSWYICRHLYISSNSSIVASSTDGNDHTCGFLGEQCLKDLEDTLTAGWGTTNPQWMCSGLTFDIIPKSCQSTFGFARAFVNAFDSTILSNTTQAASLTQDKPEASTFKIGTGFHEAGNSDIWKEALNRTYLLVNVWGWSNSSSPESRTTPKATINCLQPVVGNAIALSSTTDSGHSTTSSTSGVEHPTVGITSVVALVLLLANALFGFL